MSESVLLLFVIVGLLAIGSCMLLLAFIFALRLRRSLRHLHLKLATLGSELAVLENSLSTPLTESRNFHDKLNSELAETKSGISTLQMESRNFYDKLKLELAETKSGVSTLQTESASFQDKLTALRYIAERTRDTQKALKNDLGLLRLALGKPGDVSDIIISVSDTYENLDQNWGSFRDTDGRQESPILIEGERGRTAVIVVLGQSNAANHGSGRYVARQNVDNFNIYNSKCYRAADPLLGASGDGGNFATRLGDKLIEAGLFDRVILAPIAMGGTMVEQWADEGMFNRRIPVVIRRLHDAGLTIDFILWHQGEGNPGMGDMEGRQYRKNLWEVISTFRRYGVEAPFFVALATLCGGPHANAENIRAGQKSAVDARVGIFLGPDTDTIGVEHRWDGCHFNEIGLDMAASLWLEVIGDFQFKAGTRKDRKGLPTGHAVEPSAGGGKSWGMRSLTQQTIMSRLAAAFVVENNYRPAEGPILVADERLTTVAITSSEVAACLAAADLSQWAPAGQQSSDMVIAWEGLRHAFRPRDALDKLCGQLRAGGRLIYAQRLGGLDYLGLTPKWFLDYFVEAQYADCRIYLLWPPDRAPKVATFDYHWMADNAGPVYTPMWENITYATALVMVAEKAAESEPGVPSQDIYRLPDEWKHYAAGLRRLTGSSRPWHVTGPQPDVMPAGYRGVP